jgi:hypothetical protein
LPTRVEHDAAVRVNHLSGLEAGGSSGPSLVFQTSPGNTGLIMAFRRLDDMAGGSELAALFDLLSNDTYFTVFRDAGFVGLNFIFGDRHHCPTDVPANLHRRACSITATTC